MQRALRLGVAIGVLAVASLASAAPPEVYPLANVKRGQTGYGMTTIAGTTPERFTFEVVDVVHNSLPKQDLIMIKSDDPKLQVTGIWQGMSGSPLYLDGKLLCAVSYTYSFNRGAFGGCTPIQYMKADGDAYRRGVTTPAGNGASYRIVQPTKASLEDWHRLSPRVDLAAALDALGPAHRSWLASAPLPPAPTKASDDAMSAAVPLSVSGFSAPAFGQLEKIFAGSDVAPVRAGGSAGTVRDPNGPTKFQMGGSIAVEFIRGDMNAAAIGTVTYIDGDKVLAFGHPMFQTGESYAPVATTTVHTIIASSQISRVLASPANEVGSLVQDRQASITADTGLRMPMIPMDITVNTTSGKHVESGTFHVELLDSKFMTAQLAGLALQNAVGHYLPDRTDVTARIESTVRYKGGEPMSFVDYFYAGDGAASVMGGVRGLRVLVPLMLNPFAAVKVERIDLKVDLSYETNYGEVKEIRIPTGDLHVGRNTVRMVMTSYENKEILEDIPLDVPATLAGSIVTLEVSSGDSAKLDAAPPTDLPSLLAAIRKLLPGNVWAATIYPGEDGAAVDGKIVRDLPPSAADKLHPQSHTQRAAAYKPLARTLSPTARVINGSASILVRVR